jgi:hypothetical protein
MKGRSRRSRIYSAGLHGCNADSKIVHFMFGDRKVAIAWADNSYSDKIRLRLNDVPATRPVRLYHYSRSMMLRYEGLGRPRFTDP